MLNVFKRELKANLKGLIIWSLVMLFMAGAGFGEYGVVMGDGANAGLDSMVNMMPRIVRIMFGMGVIPIDSPQGWYACMYLWCALIAYLHAALLGAGIISKEETDKTSEFLFTKPISRQKIITGKMLAAAINSFVVVLTGWAAAMAVFVPLIKGENMTADITVTMFGMYVTALVFLFSGFFMSGAFKGRGKPAQYSGIVLMAAYVIYVVVEASEINALKFLTPFKYFDAAAIITTGFEPPYLLLSAAVAGICAYFTYRLYKKRDLHS